MISPEERAHDLAEMASVWQLEQIVKNAQKEDKRVSVNLHTFYHKYYEELVNIFKQDELFNPSNNG
jgi:hypothetical protein